LLNICPHHGFETSRLVSHFYEGLTPKDRQMVELMCNGTFEDKDPHKAMEYHGFFNNLTTTKSDD